MLKQLTLSVRKHLFRYCHQSPDGYSMEKWNFDFNPLRMDVYNYSWGQKWWESRNYSFYYPFWNECHKQCSDHRKMFCISLESWDFWLFKNPLKHLHTHRQAPVIQILVQISFFHCAFCLPNLREFAGKYVGVQG